MAGVYIKWMQMPENCEVCELATHYERYGKEDYCPFLGWFADYEKCPLVAVPDHGDLIDRQELETKMKRRRWYIGRASDPDCLVVDAPTVIPADKEV